jgi:hypothetical protein
LSEEDKLDLFSQVIMDQLEESLFFKKKSKQDVPVDYYNRVANSFIKATKNMRSTRIITYMINKIAKSNNADNMCHHFKKALEQIVEQIKTDNELYCLFHGEKHINFAISYISPENRRKLFEHTVLKNEFIKKSSWNSNRIAQGS